MLADELNLFCGFNISKSTFFTKYIYNETSKVLTPCGEFSFILLDHYIFIFFIVLGFFQAVCFLHLLFYFNYDCAKFRKIQLVFRHV